MKKTAATMIAAFAMMMFCLFPTAASAEDQDMYHAIDKKLADEHYDYDEGSLALQKVETANLDQPVEGISTLKMAVADYQTVRDNVFYKSHKDVVFYSPDTGDVVPTEKAGQIDAALAYQDAHQDETGSNVKVTAVLLFLSLILIVPGLIAFIWAKRHFSVLTYKLENNLLEGVGPNKYS